MNDSKLARLASMDSADAYRFDGSLATLNTDMSLDTPRNEHSPAI